MNVPVKLSSKIVEEAKMYATAFHRSIPKQLEFWITIGKCAEENPDLSFNFIKALLLSLEEEKRGDIEEYKFGV